jgi:ATP-dependent exoDNAse (exonuclease V) beta subunit
MKKILKASAGTGKTYRLSLEYIAAILQGQKFQEILVMTFTRKATAEIRERVIKHLEDILEKGQESDVYKSLKTIYKGIQLDIDVLQKTYQEMLINKDKINIYTIDSFINKIFKQAIAPYLGIYSYEIIEDEKNTIVIEEVFKTLLNNQEDFALMEGFLSSNTERSIQVYLDLIKKMLAMRWKFLLIDYKKRSKLKTGDLAVLLDKCVDFMKSIAAEKGKDLSFDFFKKEFHPVMKEYLRLDKNEEKRELIIKNYREFFQKNELWKINKIKGKNLELLREGLLSSYRSFLENLASYIYNEEMIPYEEDIFNFSLRVFEIYDQIKLREKIFTHTDISNYTYKYFFEEKLELLKGQTASNYFFDILGIELKSLYIDEFQDTSILQWKILKPVIDRCENLVIVGDEKQSIYGWRGGEKDLFLGLKRILKAENESLEICYRSDKGIVNFINKFFINLNLNWNYEGVEYLPDKQDAYLEILLGGEKLKHRTKGLKKLSPEKQREILELNRNIKDDLKRDIAQTIKRKLENYYNVGVLARTNKELSEIAIELDREDIPYILESRDSIIEHQAVKPLYFLLNYLTYNDYFSLIKFLRSSLIGVNNKTLKYLLRNKEQVKEFMNNEEIELDYKDIQDLLVDIKTLRKLDYQELSSYIINSSGIIGLFNGNSGALKIIYYFFRLMREFSSLNDFMNYLEENIESEELKQPGVKNDNAVRLMTIHKSKGLSFETEFFYWSPGSANSRNSNTMEIYINFDDEYQLVEDYLLTNTRYEKLFNYLGFDFAELKLKKGLIEEINSVYVAMTRPEKNLFVYIEGPRQLKADSDGKYWSGSIAYDFFEEALLNAAGVFSLKDLIEKKKYGKFLVSSEEKPVDDVLIPDLSPYFNPVIISEDRLNEFNYKKDFKMNLRKEIVRIEGLAIHYYMEHIKYNTEKERNFARAMLLSRYGNILGPDRTKEIIGRVESFIYNNPVYFNNNWKVFNEYEISEGDHSYRIDRLMIDNEKKIIMILDYKSGETKEQSQLDKYREIILKKTEGKFELITGFLNI